MRYEIFVGLVALIAESDARSLRLHARDCSFTWPAYDGDTCESMANAWSISEADFVRYNPGVNCVALEPAKDYCVEWTGAPPNGPSNPTSTPTPTPSLSPTLTPTPTFTPSPTTRSTLFTSTIPSTIVVTPAPFPTPGACSSTPAGVVTPSPIQTGLVCGCTKFYKIVSGDGCWAIANANSISLDDFYAWNPSTANGCSNLVPGNHVCIGKSGGSTTTKPTTTQTTPKPTSSAPFTLVLCSWDPKIGQYICPGVTTTTTQRPTTTTPIKNPAPGPTQTGIPSNCNKWVLQKDGVYCYDMAKTAGIALERLYALNPALKSDCSGLWPGYAYCLGTS